MMINDSRFMSLYAKKSVSDKEQVMPTTARVERHLDTLANKRAMMRTIKAEPSGKAFVENNFRMKDARWDALKATEHQPSDKLVRSEELLYFKKFDAPEAVVANAKERLEQNIPVQRGYQGQEVFGPKPSARYWLDHTPDSMKKDGTCALMRCLEDETWRENPKEENTERGYFGIPSIASQFNTLASDLSYAKKQREQPQSFIGKYEFLSNMYLCTVIIGDLVFPSAENAYQAMKCRTRKEMEEFQFITPYEAKKRGHEVELRSNWNEIRDRVMKKVLWAKFEDQELAIQLLNTDTMRLCEKNYWGDTYWGKAPVEITHYYADGEEIDKVTYNKLCKSDKPVALRKVTEKKLQGKNMLGKLLCEIRAEMQDAHYYDGYLFGYAEQADINVEWLGKC